MKASTVYKIYRRDYSGDRWLWCSLHSLAQTPREAVLIMLKNHMTANIDWDKVEARRDVKMTKLNRKYDKINYGRLAS